MLVAALNCRSLDGREGHQPQQCHNQDGDARPPVPARRIRRIGNSGHEKIRAPRHGGLRPSWQVIDLDKSARRRDCGIDCTMVYWFEHKARGGPTRRPRTVTDGKAEFIGSFPSRAYVITRL
jgi:hypothetical protein